MVFHASIFCLIWFLKLISAPLNVRKPHVSSWLLLINYDRNSGKVGYFWMPWTCLLSTRVVQSFYKVMMFERCLKKVCNALYIALPTPISHPTDYHLPLFRNECTKITEYTLYIALLLILLPWYVSSNSSFTNSFMRHNSISPSLK